MSDFEYSHCRETQESADNFIACSNLGQLIAMYNIVNHEKDKITFTRDGIKKKRQNKEDQAELEKSIHNERKKIIGALRKEGKYANKITRVLAIFFDIIIITAIFVGALSNDYNELVEASPYRSSEISPQGMSFAGTLLQLFFYVAVFSIYSVTVYYFFKGSTIGQWILSIKMRHWNKKYLNITELFKRPFCKILGSMFTLGNMNFDDRYGIILFQEKTNVGKIILRVFLVIFVLTTLFIIA